MRMIVCPVCHLSYPAGTSYCPKCGTRLARIIPRQRGWRPIPSWRGWHTPRKPKSMPIPPAPRPDPASGQIMSVPNPLTPAKPGLSLPWIGGSIIAIVVGAAMGAALFNYLPGLWPGKSAPNSVVAGNNGGNNQGNNGGGNNGGGNNGGGNNGAPRVFPYSLDSLDFAHPCDHDIQAIQAMYSGVGGVALQMINEAKSNDWVCYYKSTTTQDQGITLQGTAVPIDMTWVCATYPDTPVCKQRTLPW
jgi:hypothetical protein